MSRTAYRRSAKGRRRGSQPKARKVAPVEFGRDSFRLTCRRKRGPVKLSTLTLDGLATTFEWERSGAVMTGTMSLIDPPMRRLPGLVAKGDVVRCEVRVRPGAAWRPLWEMAVTKAPRTIADRTTALELRSRLASAQKTRRHWRYKKGRRKPKGWRAHEVARHAARRAGVKIGKLARGRHHIDSLVDKSASLVEIVTAAYKEEREFTGRRFDVSIARGVLDVVEVRRPRYMLLVGPSLMDAALSENVPQAFASAVVVTSTIKRKGSKKRRKVRAVVVDRARVRRYGYIRRHVEKKGLTTVAQARRYGKSWLARTAHPWRQITLTHAGIPWVQRGDGIRLRLPEELLTGDVYLLSARHRVDYGSYTMDLVATTTDLWKADERAARVRRRKADAARRRKRAGAARRRSDRRKAPKAKVRS